MEEATQGSSLRDFLNILFKHKAKVLVIFLTTIAAVTAGSFLIPPTYEAKSTLLVKFGRELIYRPEVGERSTDTRSIVPLNEEVINSEIQILTSQDLIEKVINTVKIENLYPNLIGNQPGKIPPMAAAIHKFEKALSVEGIKKSSIIQVNFQHRDPATAARVVNLLTELLKEKHLRVYSDTKSTFLEQQLQTFEQRLKETQNRFEDFKQKNRVFSLEEQRSLLLKQRTELDTSMKGAENQVRELRNKLATLRAQTKTVSENVPLFTETERFKIIDDAKGQLLNLQLREQQLLLKYTETSELVVNARREIAIVREFIEKQERDLQGKVRTGQNLVYQDLERESIRVQADLSSQEAKAASLRGQIAQLDRDVQNLDLKENELENLKRELSANEKNYRTYLEKVEEARISEDLNRQKMANLSVVQVAAVPAKPVRPKKELNILLSIVLGAVAGLGYAFFSEYTSQGLSTPESAERRLGLPVLTSVASKK